MSQHLRISSQVNFRSFRTPPADPGRISEILSVQKYGNFCGVRSIRHKSFLLKLHLKSCLNQLYCNLWNPPILWDVSMPAIQGSQYGVCPPSASIITRMTLGCRPIIFRAASIEQVSHSFSSAFIQIIMVRRWFWFFPLCPKSSCSSWNVSANWQILFHWAYNHVFWEGNRFLNDPMASYRSLMNPMLFYMWQAS